MPRRTLPAAAGAAAVVALGSLAGLGRSFWLDEAFTYSVASAPTGELVDLVPFNGGNMALYYALMHVWSRVGDQEWLLRLPSLLFALAALPVFALVARRLVGASAGWVATVLLGVNGSVIFAAQELRSYSLALLLVTASWLALARAVERPSGWRWAAYAACAALAVWAHLFSVLFVAAQVVSLLFAPRRSVRLRHLLVAGAVGATILAPVAVMVFSPDAARPSWIGLLSARRAADVVSFLAGRPGSLVWAWGAVWAVGLTAVVVQLARRRSTADERWRLAAVAAWAVVPVGLAFAIALTRPFLVGRYLVAALPAGALLAAVAVTRLRGGWRVAGLAAVLALSLPGLVHHLDRETPDWRAAAEYVLDGAEPGDAIVFEPPHDRTAFELYAVRDGSPPPPDPLVPPDPWRRTRRVYASGDAVAAVRSSSARRIWLVTRARVPDELQGLRVVEERTFPLTARVVLFERG